MYKEDFDQLFRTITPKFKLSELDKTNLNQDEKEILYQLYPHDKNQVVNMNIENGVIKSLVLRIYSPISLDSISQLKNLKYLSIINMMQESNPKCLKIIPDSFQKLNFLISLILLRTGMDEIPTWFQTMTSLQQFKCKNSNLQKIPEWFSRLNQLIQIDLTENQIYQLPETIGKLQNLKCLVLNGNKLSQLPESFCDLVALEDLDLIGNNLQQLPHNFGNLNALQFLQIDRNKLTEFPRSFNRLSNLFELGMVNNPWKVNPEFVHSDLPKLEYIRLNSEFESWFHIFQKRKNFQTHLAEFKYFMGTSSARINN